MALGLSLATRGHSAESAMFEENFPEARDISDSKDNSGSWVPVPIPISNPTLGTGLQAVLLYLHPTEDDQDNLNRTSGIGVMRTDNGSRAAVAFHDGHWNQGLYQYRAYAGAAELNMSYYGTGNDSIFSKFPIDYSISGSGFGGQLVRRLPGTDHWHAGLSCMFLDAAIRFKGIGNLPELPEFSRPFHIGNVGFVTTYDTRDDSYYPQAGQLFELRLTNSSELWGSNFDYFKFLADYSHYRPLTDKMVLALGTTFQSSAGETPFFDLPNLKMRGFSQDRYRDDYSLSVHAELRYKLHPRFAAVAFTEAGWIGDQASDLLFNDTVTSYGGGIRWQLTTSKSLNFGVDYAISGSENALYLRIGEVF